MKKRMLSLLLVLMLLMTGCTKDSSSTKDESGESNATTEKSATDVEEADMFSDRDLDATYDESKSVLIELNGDSVSCDSDAVEISGTRVTITDEGTFILSGTLEDGMVIVNAGEKDKPQLVLNGVSVTSKTSAPLYVLQADNVFVTLADGTANTLANGGTFTTIDDNNIDGAVFSKQDLTFNGSGSLNVTSPVGHGIVCKDDLMFTGGVYVIASASHGLDANDSVRMTRTNIKIEAGKDGIHAEDSDDTTLGFVYIKDGAYNISAEGDGMSAGNYMKIKDGRFDIVSGGGSENAENLTSDSWGDFMGGGMNGGMGPGMGGGMDLGRGGRSGGSYDATGMSTSSYTTSSSDTNTSDTSDDSSTSIKAMKASDDLMIDGGIFTIDSADDAVHSNASITVNGGTFQIASGDDGFHADETLSISAGTIEITESYEGLEALDIKVAGGDIKLVASDDGLNAAGGMDSSGTGGVRDDDQFNGPDGPGGFGGHGGMGGGRMTSNSNGSIVISGGNLYVNASGDGIDANGYLEITGGYTVVVGPTQGDTATLDYDTSATITGGTFIGTGASGMAQTFSDSQQGVVAVSVGNSIAGTTIELKDKEGNTIISYEPELNFAVVILSSPEVKKGVTYLITVGNASGEFEAS